MDLQPIFEPWPPTKGALFFSIHPPPPSPRSSIFQLVYNRRSCSHILFGGRKLIYIGIFQIYFPISVNFGRRGLNIMCLRVLESFVETGDRKAVIFNMPVL